MTRRMNQSSFQITIWNADDKPRLWNYFNDDQELCVILQKYGHWIYSIIIEEYWLEQQFECLLGLKKVS